MVFPHRRDFRPNLLSDRWLSRPDSLGCRLEYRLPVCGLFHPPSRLRAVCFQGTYTRHRSYPITQQLLNIGLALWFLPIP